MRFSLLCTALFASSILAIPASSSNVKNVRYLPRYNETAFRAALDANSTLIPHATLNSTNNPGGETYNCDPHSDGVHADEAALYTYIADGMMYLKGHKETCEIKPFFWQRISCSWQSAIWVENQDQDSWLVGPCTWFAEWTNALTIECCDAKCKADFMGQHPVKGQVRIDELTSIWVFRDTRKC